MKDQDKTKEQLISELENLRQIAESGASQRSVGNGDGRMGPDNSQWHSFVANTPVFILILDQVGCIRFANHTDSRAPPDQIVGKNLCDFCAPENRADVREILAASIKTGESGLREGPGLRLDHEEHWYASYYGPIFQDGKVIAASLISFKITEQKRAEAGLRESEERFRSLFEDSAVGTVVATPDGTFVQANRAFHEFLGYSEPELLGKTIQLVTHPEDWEATSAAIHRALTSGPRILRFEKRYLHKDGQVLWGEASSTLICDTEGNPQLLHQLRYWTSPRRKRAEEGTAGRAKPCFGWHRLPALQLLRYRMVDGRYTMQNAVSKAQQRADVVGKQPKKLAQTSMTLRSG